MTVARQLNLRYLSIDSLSIAQAKKCHTQCNSHPEWEKESVRMEDEFSAAYCTIAATCVKGSIEGFIDRCVHVKWERRPTGSFEMSTDAWDSRKRLAPALNSFPAVGDFYRDVSEAELNKRAWVLQERALSRKTLHSTNTQVCWECGRHLFCKTPTELRNSLREFLYDPHFPESAQSQTDRQKAGKIQRLFAEYSVYGITQGADRPLAIYGLISRLAISLDGLSG